MNKAYLSIGTNIGNRKENLENALKALQAESEITINRVSSVYETDPVGFEDQDAFLNIAVSIQTSLDPEALLQKGLDIESALGRIRLIRWGPRLIDIDLLLYEGVTQRSETLELPHPRMEERAFVMIPLQEIEPDVTASLMREEVLGNQGIRQTNIQLVW
ncbi:2-amino-4-hydroxy-6-hydroxymethyldihydropteridine diphosphokinase [Paenilisteria rocourtiae]|uniref:2-amino-4-hydroxy-6-hydroxymethyldihydropteridine diphosphokinase n=1 Tax=Listeria rocourtiae TaxID=647910 RepID=A0A4R6ZLF1_9LIST|nr:2-amino-4-hydroxy-6-hydroxymethyldihydropteridine diphosphokinase [Listeria rocourtiae]EUJ47109.1 2-amino-4-hydroxy-6-hydroxymethyldihydropteridine pyrophosphokinase [Listeria rocourtiae FSL F6-920]MBC1436329.1 2-amino-4-hydroxy-6-hydroxymethyldihydropteridine diphosphokinase [Listeria rocourtiae]MBC1604368.1 2-amino-4-hydroxy-6-hydroxymethyldihydropteridine diphosphokinase [Listeria rocourtiae]TDR53261.1 2-amino-4-hydroxy-6-hydroxymethyldihydropteridine diphosphokinase [Listeria rocourtiae]